MVHRRVFGATLAVTAAIVLGCGATAETATPSLQAVHGPWRAAPVDGLDEGLAHAAEAQCRAKTPAASGLPVVLHDQRGDGIDTVVFAGEDGRASCQVEGDASGQVTWLTSGSSLGGVDEPPTIDGILVDGMGSSSGSDTGTITDISGRTGLGIATLRIRLADGREITATTDNGWFYAWWPGETLAILLFGDDLDGRMVATTTP